MATSQQICAQKMKERIVNRYDNMLNRRDCLEMNKKSIKLLFEKKNIDKENFRMLNEFNYKEFKNK